MTSVISFLTEWWQVIIVAVVLLLGMYFKLKGIWHGNIVEWLVDICATMEKQQGGGTGFLKLRGAYNAFVAAFPIVSKILTFETFSALVDEALEKLKSKINTNDKIKGYIDGRLNLMIAEGIIDKTEGEVQGNASD